MTPLQLHHDAVLVDTHDLLLLVGAQPQDRQAASSRRHWLPQLRAGGFDVQVLPVHVDDPFRPRATSGVLRDHLGTAQA